MKASRLYHGGAPGFQPRSVINPHPTKHREGCPWCESGADDSHLPDRVFVTPMRLYARYYASKWGLGWLYLVEPNPDMEVSDSDSFETYHAPSFVVRSICERAIELTMTERRRLLRLWREADEARGVVVPPGLDAALERMLGVR